MGPAPPTGNGEGGGGGSGPGALDRTPALSASEKRRPEMGPAPPTGTGEGGGGGGGPERTPALVALKRTPALVEQAVRSLPPPRDRRVLLDGAGADGDGKEDPVSLALKHRGIDPDDRFDPYFDLLMFQRPVEEKRFIAWVRAPLMLHDGGLVAAEGSIIKWGAGLSGRYVDLTREMDRILDFHPGTITSLRLDSSAFPSPDLIRRWIDLLSARGVQELILLNLTREENTAPPLHQLRSYRLNHLAVAFIDITASLYLAMRDADLNGHPWSSLNQLSLTACRFNGNDLSQTILSLQGLKSVTIRSCNLNENGSRDGLCIQSPSLVELHLYNCITDNKITLEHTPTLTHLTLGVVPAVKVANTASPPLLWVQILFCSNLRSVEHIDLQNQIVAINSHHTVKVNRQNVISFPYVHTLSIAVKMTTANIASVFLSLLHSFPNVKNLALECVSDATSSHVCPGVDNVRCLTTSLERLKLKRFRGGKLEVNFVLEVLLVATSLVTLTVEAHHSTALQTPQDATNSVHRHPTTVLQWEEVVTLFRNHKAKACELIVVPPTTDEM